MTSQTHRQWRIQGVLWWLQHPREPTLGKAFQFRPTKSFSLSSLQWRFKVSFAKIGRKRNKSESEN